MILSDDDAKEMCEMLILAVTTEVDLGSLMYKGGPWAESLEVHVNGQLRQPIGDYTVAGTHVVLTSSLQPGDTFRATALPSLS